MRNNFLSNCRDCGMPQQAGVLALALAGVLGGAATATTAEIRIDCDKPTVALSPHLYGLFFEDINFGADGGLYAELVQNRSFEYNTQSAPEHEPLFAWEKVERDGAKAGLAVVKKQPLNSNNTNYLEITVSTAGEAGARNLGFDGIAVTAGAKYDVSFYTRCVDWTGGTAVNVALELSDGTSAGSVSFDGIGTDWKKLSGVITATKTADDARLLVTAKGEGILALDMVSLFPQDTFKGRKNGLRKDIAETLAELHPKFFRFPGGCVAHGQGLKNIYNWKDTVGDVAERKPNWNLWGYHQTYGLGFFEYFQLCEDLDMTPLPVIPVGVSCGFRGLEVVPMNELQPHVDNALDLIEFAKGPATSKWGSVRAKMGHPEPFDLEFVSLGNEEHDNPQARERFPYFVDAIRKKYPEIKIIGTSGLGTEIPLYDLMTKQKVFSSDEHYYELPEWFILNQGRFDKFDRSKPKIFVGEYASWSNTVFSGVSEAAYLTGVERNGDMVDMTCYAPLFGREGHSQWNPDMIYFDQRRVVRSVNYYVQQLFAKNKGDVYLANTFKTDGVPAVGTVRGNFGIGSAKTVVEVKEATIDGRMADLSGWASNCGKFAAREEAYVQIAAKEDFAMLLSPDASSGETGILTGRVRKTSGDDGFLVLFGADADGKSGYVWTVGADNNTKHLLQQVADYRSWSKLTLAEGAGKLSEDQWHDVKVELSPARIRCFFDGKQVLDHMIVPFPISVASTLDREAGEVIVKLVNPNEEPVKANIMLVGAKDVASKARLISISGAKNAKNTFEDPDAAKPVTTEIEVAPEFTHTVPPMAVEFIRVKTNGTSP